MVEQGATKPGRFLYYVSGVQCITDQNAAEVYGRLGIAHVLEGAAIESRPCSRGPDGTAGCVWIDPAPAEKERVGYYPGEQTWRQVGAIWIGYWTERALPGPDELRRREQVGTVAFELGDGRDWVIPMARLIGDKTELPRRIDWGPDGEEVYAILPQYAEFCQRAEEAFAEVATLLSDGVTELTRPQTWFNALALEAIGLNYRVGKAEAGVLGLLTTQNVQTVLMLVLGMQHVDVWEMIKKKEESSEGLTSTDGG